MLTVVHYGAVMNGVTDDMPAVKRMHAGMRKFMPSNTIGIVIPAGNIALSSSFDDSKKAEQPIFRLRGPMVENGASPLTRVYFLDALSHTPVFQVNARRMEISGLHLMGAGTVTPFYKNVCPAGQYIRVKAVRCEGNGGLVFDVPDTIDTKFDQVYCYRLSGGFLRSLWSNTVAGGWNHSTAIEITNSNFTSCTTVEAISAFRATQSRMVNVWFSSNEYVFDVSQGGWLFDTVIQESSKYSSKTKYAKIVYIDCRFEQGATLSDALSGYTPDMDNGAKLPNWVTNSFDQGSVRINSNGSRFKSGFGAHFVYPTTILQNGNNAETWFYVGKMILSGLGRTAIVRLTGAKGWDSASSAMDRPGGANFGAGEAKIFIEMKQPNAEFTKTVEAHWHGEGACPISEVRIVHNWQTIFLYVKVAQYARYVGVFIETNGIPRSDTGNPFFFIESNTQIADINTVANTLVAPCRWVINKGAFDGNGFGMDLDSGDLLYFSSSLQGVAAANYIQAYVNGEKRFIPYYKNTGSVLIPRYAYADLPSPATHVYGLVLCTNTRLKPTMQPLFSDGSNWYPVSDPGAAWKPV